MPTDLTPMEKMDVVYDIIVDGENRRKSEYRYRIFKWLVILLVVYGVFSNPEFVISKIVGVMQPIIMEQMKGVIESQKESLLQQAKDMLPDSN